MTNIEEHDLHDIADLLVVALGDGWTVGDAICCSSVIEGPDGARLKLTFVNDRLVIRGLFSGEPWRAPGRHRITVAASRDPGRIAQEIRRRLLPDYLVAVAYALERLAQERAANLAREAIIAKLTTLPGVTKQRVSKYDAYLNLPRGVGGTVTANIFPELTVDLAFSNVTVANAEAIIRLLSESEVP